MPDAAVPATSVVRRGIIRMVTRSLRSALAFVLSGFVGLAAATPNQAKPVGVGRGATCGRSGRRKT